MSRLHFSPLKKLFIFMLGLLLAHGVFAEKLSAFDKPLSNQEAQQICKNLANLADNKRLKALFVTPENSKKENRNGFLLPTYSEIEEKQLSDYADFAYRVADYLLPISAKNKATHFSRFAPRGTCHQENLFNPAILLKNKGKYLGIETVDDPDNAVGWAHRGAIDFPLFYRERYFIATVTGRQNDQLGLISWIKPDGNIRPLCAFDSKEINPKISQAKKPALCQKVLTGKVQALPWQEDVPQEGFREFQKKWDFSLATKQELDIDNDGRRETIGLFRHDSGAGCGGAYLWLNALNEEGGKIVSSPLDPIFNKLKQVYTREFDAKIRPLTIYALNGKNYVVALSQKTAANERDLALLKIKQNEIETVCEFSAQRQTKISRFFKVD